MFKALETPIQEIKESMFEKARVRLFIKRDDLNNPLISGNKFWKLKHNFRLAIAKGHTTVLTFGGAYSNHIYATACAAFENNLSSIGIIRGECSKPLNPTLQFAEDHGMLLHYISRDQYKYKIERNFLDELEQTFGSCYLIPEGGSNRLAIEGVMELAKSIPKEDFDVWCTPVGTGGTLAGLVLGSAPPISVLGFSALKGAASLDHAVRHWVEELKSDENTSNWSINHQYHFGGYGKMKDALFKFLNTFYQKHEIRLDPLYNGKMIAGLYDLIDQGYFPSGTRILAFHTGGLQGWKGFEPNYSL